MLKVRKEKLYAFFQLKKRWVLVFDFLTLISLVYVFMQDIDDSPIAYFVYIFSFYALLITVVLVYKLSAKMRNVVFDNKHIHQYYVDIQYRMQIKLYASVAINFSYAILKLVLGCYYQSIWEVHIGTYYFIICIARYMLLRQMNYTRIGKDTHQEMQKYKICSYFLIILNMILSGMVILMVVRNYTYDYPGYIIYIAAMYTFYIVITAIVNVIKLRKYKSPLINAINILCFITALASILNLQTAMLTQFGSENLADKQIANTLTGTFICVLIFILSFYMMFYAKRELKNRENV